MIGKLRTRWDRLVSRYKIEDLSTMENFFELLVKAYSAPTRKYHNLNHIYHMFEELDHAGVNSEAVEWAVWWHDYVYVVGRADNEQASAHQYEVCMSHLDVPVNMAYSAKQMILMAAHHEAPYWCDDETLLFLDADLSILGQPHDVYKEYTAAVRSEYSEIQDHLYNRGRTLVLTKFLQKEHIYATAYFRDLYEQQARINISWELLDLALLYR